MFKKFYVAVIDKNGGENYWNLTITMSSIVSNKVNFEFFPIFIEYSQLDVNEYRVNNTILKHIIYNPSLASFSGRYNLYL